MTMQDDLVALARIKVQAEDLAAEKTTIEARIITALEKKGQKSLVVMEGANKVSGTLVAPQRVTVDEERLRKALTAKDWKTITRLVLDKTLLEAAVAVNQIDANVVAQCSDVKDTKPYIKVSGDVRAIGTAPAAKKRAVRPKPRSGT